MSVQLIIDQQGPLPIKATFNSMTNEPVFVEVNGSVWSTTPNTLIGILVEVDGVVVGKALIFSNGPSTHRAVVPSYGQVQLGPGQHTIVLSPVTPTTTSDVNDFYTAVIHY
ncbi:MAG TPA: hypothetical protein VF290_27180 [Pyrinomonadaceae bacterium]